MWVVVMLLVIILHRCNQKRWEDDRVVLCVCEHGVGCLNALKCIGPYPQRALTLVLAREIFSILFIYFVRLIYSYAKQKILKCTFTSKQSFV